MLQHSRAQKRSFLSIFRTLFQALKSIYLSMFEKPSKTNGLISIEKEMMKMLQHSRAQKRSFLSIFRTLFQALKSIYLSMFDGGK